MKLSEIIKSRRTSGPAQFSGEEVSKEQIEQLLEAANWAPTHRKTEPWRFKVLRGEALKKLGEFLGEKYKETASKFSEFKYKKTILKPQQSSAVIAICMQRDPDERVPEWEELAATAMAVQNLWLTATEMGLGGYWSSPGTIKYMDEFFDLASGEKCLGFFYLGHLQTPSPDRVPSPVENKTEWL